jgi:phosphoenolpyruvate mutase
MKTKKNVYIGFAASSVLSSHLNLFKKAYKLGNVIVGLFTDKAILEFDDLPNIKYEDRLKILSSIKFIKKIVPQDTYDYTKNLNLFKPDIVLHGNLWKGMNGLTIKKKIINSLKKWNGKLIETNYDYSTVDKEKELSKKLLDAPYNRISKLDRLLKNKEIIRFLECHNPLSGSIIENIKIFNNKKIEEFDGMWSSSLADSAIRAKPDNQAVDYSTRINSISEIFEATSKPMLFDADNGGRLEHLPHLINKLEKLGVSAIVMEDKVGLKQNSLFGNKIQKKAQQDKVENFCKKIKEIKRLRKNSDFLIFARVESLILKKGMKDALIRSKKYHHAGADVILIHSKEKSPKEIFEFSKKFHKIVKNPIIAIVPSTYSKVYEHQIIKNKIKIVIYANQLLRSIYPSMRNTAESILKNKRSYDIEKKLTKISEIIRLFE